MTACYVIPYLPTSRKVNEGSGDARVLLAHFRAIDFFDRRERGSLSAACRLAYYAVRPHGRGFTSIAEPAPICWRQPCRGVGFDRPFWLSRDIGSGNSFNRCCKLLSLDSPVLTRLCTATRATDISLRATTGEDRASAAAIATSWPDGDHQGRCAILCISASGATENLTWPCLNVAGALRRASGERR